MCMIFTEQEYKIGGLAVPICLILIRDNQDNHGSHEYICQTSNDTCKNEPIPGLYPWIPG